MGKGRKVWEGSQKSDGEEKTVGGLGIWLLKAVRIGGLVSTITPRTGFVGTATVGPTTAIGIAVLTSS